MKDLKEINRSLIKTYKKAIWKKTIKAIDEYQLISEGDTIAVCISGGKDSFLLACVLKEINRHYKIKFNLRFLCMNPGYSETHLNKIKQMAAHLEIPLEIFNTPIFEIIKNEKNPCYLCARMRRGYLYSKAQELGCNKIALGHHFNDVIETILLNMLYAGQFGSMLPKIHSDNFENMTLIRPLYLVKEYDIKRWMTFNELEFIDCACSITKKKSDSKRQEMKELIEKLKEVYDDVDKNIFKASENVNLDTLLGYYDGDNRTSFLDRF